MEKSSSGKTDRDIAFEMHCSVPSVRLYRIRNGMKKKNGRPSKVDDVEALKLYKFGKSDRKIAFRLGVGSASVFRWRARNGLPPVEEYLAQKEVAPKCQ